MLSDDWFWHFAHLFPLLLSEADERVGCANEYAWLNSAVAC